MPLYAFNFDGQLICARQALRQTDYQCFECQQIVRLRGGPQRQRHFYHLEPTSFCRQHQKGPVHLQLQSYFLQQLPKGDCQLEYSFPSIRRIADVAWLSQKIVFEIQFSPITSEELLARNQDYQKMGWKVVWILHDQRYNQVRLSAAEIALRSSPHFFSNMDHQGVGMIYDQFDICEKGIRQKRLSPLPIQVNDLQFHSSHSPSYPLTLLANRSCNWNLSFSGDLLSLFFKNPHSEYLSQAIKIEKNFYHESTSLTWRNLPSKFWNKGIVTPYQIFFRFLLERMCR